MEIDNGTNNTNMGTKNFDTKRFVIEQGLISSVNAAMRRIHIYENRRKASKEEYRRKKDEMREDFAKAIIKMANKINCAPSDQEKVLVQSIGTIVKKLKSHKNIFTKGQPSFGVAQKALNLFLKYLWCLGISKRPPPHCPIDTQILKGIKWNSPKKPGVAKSWSSFEKMDYEDAIKMVREKSKKRLIAEWELAEWESSLNISEKKLRQLLG